jgi:hypothetical protein
VLIFTNYGIPSLIKAVTLGVRAGKNIIPSRIPGNIEWKDLRILLH